MNSKFRKETTYDGIPVIISVVELPDGTYEGAIVMSDGETIGGLVQSPDIKVMERWFNRKVKDLEPPPLKGKYAKLRDDLVAALDAGAKVERTFKDDGGTCNLDSTVLILPRWSKKLVEQAVKEAGSRCFKGGYSSGYIVSPKTNSQGEPRTVNAQEVAHFLREVGYDAYVWYQMD